MVMLMAFREKILYPKDSILELRIGQSIWGGGIQDVHFIISSQFDIASKTVFRVFSPIS
jgi:hypothetical protein